MFFLADDVCLVIAYWVSLAEVFGTPTPRKLRLQGQGSSCIGLRKGSSKTTGNPAGLYTLVGAAYSAAKLHKHVRGRRISAANNKTRAGGGFSAAKLQQKGQKMPVFHKGTVHKGTSVAGFYTRSLYSTR